MIINCPSCKTRYKVDPAQFGPKGRRVRCTACSNLWTEKAPDNLPQPVDLGASPMEDAAEQAAARRCASRLAAGPRAAPEEKRGGAKGWMALAIVVIAILSAGALAKDSIIHAWPPAERLYTVIGFPVTGPKSWLNIEVVGHDQVIKDGRTILILRGKVTNISEKVRDVPKLQAWIRAEDARELATWVFPADKARLVPGEAAGFITRFQNPPAGAAALSVDFSDKEK